MFWLNIECALESALLHTVCTSGTRALLISRKPDRSFQTQRNACNFWHFLYHASMFTIFSWGNIYLRKHSRKSQASEIKGKDMDMKKLMAQWYIKKATQS